MVARSGALLRIVRDAIGEEENEGAVTSGTLPVEHDPQPATILPGDWSEALRELRPASRLGPLFGVTAQDLRQANLSLSMRIPVYSCGPLLVKAVFDRLLALILLVFLLPIMACMALAVRLTTAGPAFFRQTRIGKAGRPFTMYKFRTMDVDGQAQLEKLLTENPAGLVFKMHRDPRITPVGRWLRRCSLDELPQLLNVIKGEMSLVGPRPPLPREVAQYEADAHRRLMVKPGLTGLWQVSGRSDLTWDEAMRLDLEYAENWSLALDLLILWRTIFAVATGAQRA
jgi:exopolysaccharide biosynthesis polyprenyl glycosylphosphotransferase